MNQEALHSEPASVRANGLDLVYDTFGTPETPPLLLISGLGCQLIDWDDKLCSQLALRGYWVIRFDNRDVGLSTKFDAAGVPDLPGLMEAVARGEPLHAPYLLQDMADDAAGLLDALGVVSAHVVGHSMGGMIAQELALRHPARVRTLTSMSSTTGDPTLPSPAPEAMAVLMAPLPADVEGFVEATVQASRVLNGSGFALDEDLIRQTARRAFERGVCDAGTARQLAAIFASASRQERLHSLTMPALVIHGSDDCLIPLECGLATKEAIPQAKLLVVDGMGHVLAPGVQARIIDAIAAHAASN